MPEVDDKEFTDAETKLAINLYPEALDCTDINQSQEQNFSFKQSRLWVVFLCIFFGALGLSFIQLN